MSAVLAQIASLRSARLSSLLTLNVLLQLLGAGLGLLGQWLVNHHDWTGFVCWLGSNAALVVLQLRMRLFVLVVLHMTYFALCVDGLLTWLK